MLTLLAWTGAVLWFGVGDVLTTLFGTRRAGLVEGAPLAKAVSGEQPSVASLVALKALGLLVAFVGAELLVPGPYRVVVPLTVAAMGVAVTAYNLAMIRRARRRGWR